MLSFEQMLRAIDSIVSKEFDQKGGIESRAALIMSDDLIFHPLIWDDDNGKERAFVELRKRIRALKPERYAIVGEAWKAPWPEHPALFRASKSDQCIETVYVLLVDRSGQNCLAMRPIETPHWSRDPRPGLGPISVEYNLEGYFTDLFGK